jgi:hypothetical protein
MAKLILLALLCSVLDPSSWLAALRLLERWEGADPFEMAWKGTYPA